jgi:hypothetical protein
MTTVNSLFCEQIYLQGQLLSNFGGGSTPGKDGIDGVSIVGPEGPRGVSGPRGDTTVITLEGDEKIISGPPGTMGADGREGKIGPSGAVGEMGKIGFVGRTGLTGLTGARGPPGEVTVITAEGEPTMIMGPKGDPGPEAKFEWDSVEVVEGMSNITVTSLKNGVYYYKTVPTSNDTVFKLADGSIMGKFYAEHVQTISFLKMGSTFVNV